MATFSTTSSRIFSVLSCKGFQNKSRNFERFTLSPIRHSNTTIQTAGFSCSAHTFLSAFASGLASASSSASFSSAAGVTSIPATMLAQVLTFADPNNWRMNLEQMKTPQPKAGEVLIKVRACGVCHTDLHVMKKEVAFPVPAVMGHEISGQIVAFGESTSATSHSPFQLKLGDDVVCPFIMPCASCHLCTHGQEDLCDTFFTYNRGRGTLYDGHTRLFRQKDNSPIAMYSMAGLAQYCVVPSTAVFPISLPASSAASSSLSSSSSSSALTLSECAILGCALFTAYGAVKHGAALRVGESIAILGVGGVGANAVQVARAFGADRIIAVDVSDDKLAAAQRFGATHLVNATKTPGGVVEAVRAASGGRGVDVCLEALGRKDTFSQAIQCVTDGGRAVMVGIAPAGQMAEVEITRVVRRKIQIVGSYGAKARVDMPEIIQLVKRGVIDVKGAVTRTFSLKDADEAYRLLNQGKIVGRAIVDMQI